MIKTYKPPHTHTHTHMGVPSGSPSCYRLITPPSPATSLYSPSPPLHCYVTSIPTLPNHSLLSEIFSTALCTALSLAAAAARSAIGAISRVDSCKPVSTADQHEAVRPENGGFRHADQTIKFSEPTNAQIDGIFELKIKTWISRALIDTRTIC